MFILTKKGDINTQKTLGNPRPPKGFFFIFVVVLFWKCLKFSESLDLGSNHLGEMFGGESADTCGGTFPLVSMGC